jgi:DNA-binding LytR/AlgR family response regulator
VDVLIVEDEWLIAEELKDRLEDMGHNPIGPALNCSEALELLRHSRPDVAILDTELGDETCEPVLTQCVRDGIPIVISTGHDAAHLPSFIGDRIIITKPNAPDDLAKALMDAVATTALWATDP